MKNSEEDESGNNTNFKIDELFLTEKKGHSVNIKRHNQKNSQIEWVKRKDNTKPWGSMVPFKSLKESYPTLIIEFLEGILNNGKKFQIFDVDD